MSCLVNSGIVNVDPYTCINKICLKKMTTPVTWVLNYHLVSKGFLNPYSSGFLFISLRNIEQ